MKLEQELEIQELLKNWRDERHLTLEMQNEGLLGNLCEEMAEYYRAKNESEKIDALCDIYVFCMNSLDGDLEAIREELERQIYLRVYQLNDLKLFFITEIEKKLKRLKKEKIIGDFNLFLYVLMGNVECEAQALGYDFYTCMMETIKEISSRTGHYDENIHKFIKDKSDEAVKKWYKADYEKCKISLNGCFIKHNF